MPHYNLQYLLLKRRLYDPALNIACSSKTYLNPTKDGISGAITGPTLLSILDEQGSRKGNSNNVASNSGSHDSGSGWGSRVRGRTAVSLLGRGRLSSGSAAICCSRGKRLGRATARLAVSGRDRSVSLRNRVPGDVGVSWRNLAAGGEGDLAHGVMDDGAIVHGVDEVALGQISGTKISLGNLGKLTIDGGRSNFLGANGLGVLGIGCSTLALGVLHGVEDD